MNTKHLANRILFFYLSIMLLLTLYGENLYHLTIPKVVTERVVQKLFPFEIFVDGIKVVTYRKALAVPLEALRSGFVLIVNETEKGGFVEKLEIQTGEILDGWIEVTSGLYEKKKVIVGSDRNLTSGQKVLETEWNNDVCLHTWREMKKDITEYEGKAQRALLKDGYLLLMLTVSTIGVMILLGRFFREKELFRYMILLLWLLLCCHLLKRNLVIPAEWIPRKLIYFVEWIENVKKYTF